MELVVCTVLEVEGVECGEVRELVVYKKKKVEQKVKEVGM